MARGRQTIAEFLADSLWDIGVRKVFGLPGGENVNLVDALDRRGLKFYLVRNESSAAYAAAACYRISGRPQACLTTLGPGITHGAAGLGHLWLDRAAVVFLSARTAENAGPLHTHQVLDLTSLAGPMAKSSFAANTETAHQIPDVLSLMLDGRPGPVHLQLSNEAAGRELAESGQFKTGMSPGKITHAEGLERHRADEAVEQIRCMKRPVILVGLGVATERNAKATVALADATQAPVLVTPKAKGTISDKHELSAGVIGLTRSDPAYQVLDSADGVLAIGFDAVELVKHWHWKGPMVWISDWPNQNPKIPSTVELTGSLFETLSFLSRQDWDGSKWYLGDLGPSDGKFQSKRFSSSPEGNLSPQQVLTILRKAAPADARVTVDVGSHKIFFSLEWPTYEPNGFLLSNGLSCMGYGLASAIGAGTEDLQKPVFGVMGDGGLAMCAGELGLLREISSNTKIIVLKDRALDLIRSAQNRMDKKPVGTEFKAEVDHVKLAEAFGIPGAHASKSEEFESALNRALEESGPFLIEVALNPELYPTTPSN